MGSKAARMTYGRRRGFTLIELLIVVAIIGILAAIAIPNLMSAQRKAKYSRAASDTKTATSQTVLFAGERGSYPSTIEMLRINGYATVADNDPWARPYELSANLKSGSPPALADDVYIFSKGASGSGAYPEPFVANTGLGGSVGYSSMYGGWIGQ